MADVFSTAIQLYRRAYLCRHCVRLIAYTDPLISGRCSEQNAKWCQRPAMLRSVYPYGVPVRRKE